MADARWVLDVDELSRLWDECRRCAYLAAARRFPRPEGAGDDAIARLVATLAGPALDQIGHGAPATVVARSPTLVSAPYDVPLPDRVERCAVRVKPDVIAACGTATLVAAITIGDPGALGEAALSRRLHAAAWALERPLEGRPSDVGAIGMLVWTPPGTVIDKPAAAALTGSVDWRPLARDDASFLGFLAEAAAMLSEAAPPAGSALCPWCVYRDASRRTGL